MDVPDFATHYYLADKKPFLNLSELSESELGLVLGDLERRRTQSDFKRVFGRRYMDLRRLTEGRLLDLFRQAGGKPERTCEPGDAAVQTFRSVPQISLGRSGATPGRST